MKVETRKEFVYVLYRNVGHKFCRTEEAAWEYIGQFAEINDIYPFLYSQLPEEEQEFITKKYPNNEATELARKYTMDAYKLLFGSEKFVCKLRVLLQEVVEF